MAAKTDRRVSVVIATRNGAVHLAGQLTALADQQLDGHFDVIIADNGSTDETVKVALHHAGHLDLNVVDASARRGCAFARNVGVAAARAPRIVFLDDDDVVAPGYLTAMAAALDRFELVAARVDGRTLNPAWRAEMRPVDVLEGLRTNGAFPWALGCALGVTRRAFDLVDGFDPWFSGTGDDVDFCRRMHDAGIELHLVTEAVVHRRLRTSRRSLFDQGRRYAVSAFSKRRRGPRRRGSLRVLAGGIRLVILGRNRSERALGIYLVGRAVGQLEGAIRRHSSRTRSRAEHARRDHEHLHEMGRDSSSPANPQ